MTQVPTQTDSTIQDQVQQTALPVLKTLLAAWQAAAIYEENNQAYLGRRDDLRRALATAFSETGECRIAYQRGYFFFNGGRLNYDQGFMFGRSLAGRFAALKMGELIFEEEPSVPTLDQALFALGHADTRSGDPFKTLLETWSELGLGRITIAPSVETPFETPDRVIDPADESARKRRRARAIFHRVEHVVGDMWQRVRDRNSFDTGTMHRIVHQLIDQIAHDEDTLLEFAALKDFDDYTYYHSVNVSIYSIAVGMRLGLDRKHLARLGLAALFHDIGKVKLPNELITKPEEFDEDDWVQIKRHPSLGAMTLASIRKIDHELAISMAGAFEHHRRMDGSGYPPVKNPRPLHLYSRIISLCDGFDAMTSGRVYQRESISPDEAMRRLLYKAKEWHDPVVVKAFVHALGVFPVGTLAKLSDGCLGVVIRNNSDNLYAPDIVVIREADGTSVHRLVSLCSERGDAMATGIHIAEILEPEEEGIRIVDYVGTMPAQEETAVTLGA